MSKQGTLPSDKNSFKVAIPAAVFEPAKIEIDFVNDTLINLKVTKKFWASVDARAESGSTVRTDIYEIDVDALAISSPSVVGKIEELRLLAEAYVQATIASDGLDTSNWTNPA